MRGLARARAALRRRRRASRDRRRAAWPRRRPARSACSAACFRLLDRGLERRDIVGVGRRLLARVGLAAPARAPSPSWRIAASLAPDRSGTKLSTVLTPRDLRQLGQLLGRRPSPPPRSAPARRSSSRRARIAAQIEEGRDRFDLRAAQIERIEVELQAIQQRQPGRDHEPGADDDRNAMPLHEAVDRRERLVAQLLRFARRVEQRQQRRHQRDAGEERDDHAEAGDQAELGDAL